EADARVELRDERVHLCRIRHVVTRDEEVARVEAETQPGVAVEALEERVQLVERAPDRPACARGVLHQEPRVAFAAFEDLRERLARAVETAVESGAEMRADVEDDAVRADRARRVDR